MRSTEAHRLAVHHEVHVDPGLGPEEQAGEVGDRGDRRARHLAAAAQAREHDGDRRVGGDDHVGLVFGDRARQRARAEAGTAAGARTSGRARRARAASRRPCRSRGRTAAARGSRPRRPGAAAAHRGEPVDDGHLGRLRGGLDLLAQRACGRGVALADVGGEDQDALRRPGVRRRACGGACRCGVRMTVRAARAAAVRLAPTSYARETPPAGAWLLYRDLSGPVGRLRRAGRRNNGHHAGRAPPYPAAGARRPRRATPRLRRPRERARRAALRALGALGLLGVLASVLLLCAGAAGRPRRTCRRAAAAGRAGWRGRSRARRSRSAAALPDADAADVRRLRARARCARGRCRCGRSWRRSWSPM